MPNKNYERAVAQERRVRDKYIAEGYIAARSAGSHSAYDVYAVRPSGETVVYKNTSRGVEYSEYVTPVTGFAIQCKRRKLKRAKDRVPSRRRTSPSKPPSAVPLQNT